MGTRRISRGSVLAAGITLLLAGCTAETAPGSIDGALPNEPNARGRLQAPALYIDRIVQYQYTDGVNKLREGYEQSLRACREAGLPTDALSEAEVERVGAERWQLWRSPDRVAVREEKWHLSNGDPGENRHCEFFLETTGQHALYTEGETVIMDLGSGELARLPASPDVLESTIAQDSPSSAEIKALHDVSGPVSRMIAGQPCTEWTGNSGESVCRWSGGRMWGYDDTYRNFESNGVDLDSFVLGADPGSTIGPKLDTKTFTVGEPLDVDAMTPSMRVKE